jgi:hypothetical protein
VDTSNRSCTCHTAAGRGSSSPYPRVLPPPAASDIAVSPSGVRVCTEARAFHPFPELCNQQRAVLVITKQTDERLQNEKVPSAPNWKQQGVQYDRRVLFSHDKRMWRPWCVQQRDENELKCMSLCFKYSASAIFVVTCI